MVWRLEKSLTVWCVVCGGEDVDVVVVVQFCFGRNESCSVQELVWEMKRKSKSTAQRLESRDICILPAVCAILGSFSSGQPDVTTVDVKGWVSFPSMRSPPSGTTYFSTATPRAIPHLLPNRSTWARQCGVFGTLHAECNPAEGPGAGFPTRLREGGSRKAWSCGHDLNS